MIIDDATADYDLIGDAIVDDAVICDAPIDDSLIDWAMIDAAIIDEFVVVLHDDAILLYAIAGFGDD